ncbi:MAG: lipoate--protein ligase [Mariniphaga sp.]
MRCIISQSNNPHFNLSAEEYFLRNSDEEFFFLYINEPCIVVGKHQNLLSEINLRFVTDHNIKLARRISGGGAVYQDLNNLNFSFIHNAANPDQLNFPKFTAPVLNALKDMGLAAEFSGRNDLLIDSGKVSGNAMHIFKSRILSHGTLLFNSDLNCLSEALKNHPERYIDKSIKSVRSKVTNISKYLGNSISMELFCKYIFNNITEKLININTKHIDNQEIIFINHLLEEKFSTWDWIYGYSPKYVFKNGFSCSDQRINLELNVEKGIITNIKTDLDLLSGPECQHSIKLLNGVKHDYTTITELLKNDDFLKSSPSFSIFKFCENLF